MCGRFTLTLTLDDLQRAFPEFDFPADWEPRYNVAPTQDVPVVPNKGPRQMTGVRWGLIPFWAKDPSIGNRMINARAETLAEKPSFRAAYRRRRCLVLADGFYEWKREPGQRRKTPYLVRMASGEPFAFAGLWEIWRPDDTPIVSCTIITTEPNAVVAPIHNRMPVILPREAYDRWLSPEEQSPRALQSLLGPYPGDEMMAHPVSTYVNSPAHEGPQCVAPLTD
jgi:putative SOS response-associated peptidase YedK